MIDSVARIDANAAFGRPPRRAVRPPSGRLSSDVRRCRLHLNSSDPDSRWRCVHTEWISVSRGRPAARLAALRTLGNVFPKESFVSSPLEERARYIFALSQEVQQTLMQLDGIVDARVHIALPERSLLDDKPQSASASVVIIERPGANLELRETDIKAIVTDGIEGLKDINRVTVKFFTRHAAAGVATAAVLDEPPVAAR